MGGIGLGVWILTGKTVDVQMGFAVIVRIFLNSFAVSTFHRQILVQYYFIV